MTIDADIADELSAPQARRDRLGRYRIADSASGKLGSFTRATTVAKTLDDTSNLERWASRMTALGLAARPDLLALVAATEADDKKALNDIVERAKEAGGATARRDLGTALHSILEKSWTPGYEPPAAYAADVAAVHAALAAAGLSVVDGMAERVVVDDRHRIAGTFDLMVSDGTDSYIADIKTGASVTYGGLGFAVQLAIYANADALYTFGAKDDGSDDVREPMPDVANDRALIIHVEPGSGRCDLHWLDIALGAKALDLALAVREIRKSKPLKALAIEAAQPTEVAESRHAFICARIDDLKAHSAEAVQALARRWPAGVPRRGQLDEGQEWAPEHIDAVEAVVVEVSSEFGVTFPTLLAEPPKQRDIDTSRRPLPDEGEAADDEEVKALQLYVNCLDPEPKAWIMAVGASTKHNGRPISLKQNPSQRRWLIVRALWKLALVEPDDGLLRQLVGIAMGDEVQPAVPLGLAVGSLSIEEAERLGRLVDALGGALNLTYSDDGIGVVGDVAAVAA